MKSKHPRLLAIFFGSWVFLILAILSCANPPIPTNSAIQPTENIIKTDYSTGTDVETIPLTTPTLPPTTPKSPSLQTEIPSVQSPSSTPNPTSTVIELGLRPTVIGTSVSGRPLEVYRFGFGGQSRMIVAGIHGGYEWNTIALAHKIVEYLQNNPDFIPQGMRLYILVALNPDGEARSHGYGGRANENGVDINRNFPEYWQPEWNRQGCWDVLPITAGTKSASEPETQSLMRFIQTHPLDALVSYHSAALGIFPGGRPPDIKSVKLAETIASISTYPYPPIDGGCEFTGQLVDWTSSLGIASVDIELTNHEDLDFEMNLEILHSFLNWEP